MSERPTGVPPASAPEPRDSSSAIVLRRGTEGHWEVLLGLRSRRSRFMPGHLSCPGGAAEPADRFDEPGGYLRCVRRELQEESGLDVPADRWIEAGQRTTPPMFPVRFHTRFFLTHLADEDPGWSPTPASGENESFRFAPADLFLQEWRQGAARIPPPIVPILRAIDQTARSPSTEVALRVAAANAQEERAPRIEFVPDVWMLPVRSATLPPATHTNVWMPGGRRFVIVDPGSSEAGELQRLLEVVERRRQAGDEPVAVLLTHHHRDHVAGVEQVCESLGLPLRAHTETLRARGGFAGCDAEPLADGEELDLAGMTLCAIHTPGHAAGHLAFHLCEPNLLIVGDLVSGLSTILIDPREGDMDAYLESLSRADKCGARLLLPGHGPPLAPGQIRALIDHRLLRDQQVLDALEGRPRDLSEIARDAYPETPRLPPRFIESQTLSHLLRLERQGKAARADAVRGSWQAVTEGT